MDNYTVVIRSVNNSEKFKKTIESVCAQSISADEIIICIPNDAIEWSVAHSNVKFVHSTKGMVSQRFEGIFASKNKYILLLDDDIDLDTDVAKKMLHEMERNKVQCIVPYWPELWPKSLFSKIFLSVWGIAIPKASGGIQYTPSGGFFYPTTNENVHCVETEGGNGAVLLIDKDFLIAKKIEPDFELELVSPYAAREDAAFIMSFIKQGGKALMVSGLMFQHLEGTTKSVSNADFIRIKGQVVNQFLFWRKYIFPRYKNNLFNSILSILCLFWHYIGFFVISLLLSLRKTSHLPISGFFSGIFNLIIK